MSGRIVNIRGKVFAVFGIAGHDQAGRTARNTAAHSPAVGTGFGIFQAQVAGIAQTVINQRGNFFLTAGRGIGRVKNRRTGRQVGSEADLLGRSSRTADGGQVNRTQVAVINNVVIDVNGFTVGIIISFHIIDTVNVNDAGIRIAVPRQQRPALRIETAGIDQIAVVIQPETAGTGISPHVAFSRISRLIDNKETVAADGHIRRNRS